MSLLKPGIRCLLDGQGLGKRLSLNQQPGISHVGVVVPDYSPVGLSVKEHRQPSQEPAILHFIELVPPSRPLEGLEINKQQRANLHLSRSIPPNLAQT